MRRGDFVTVELGGRQVSGMVVLASDNGDSLMLMFDAMLEGYAGMMARVARGRRVSRVDRGSNREDREASMTGVDLECDFCSSPFVVCRYQCMDFDAESADAGIYFAKTLDTPPTNYVLASKSYWSACAACALLVDAEDCEGLLKRVIGVYDAQGWKNPLARIGFVVHLQHTYKLFFKNRIRVRDGNA